MRLVIVASVFIVLLLKGAYAAEWKIENVTLSNMTAGDSTLRVAALSTETQKKTTVSVNVPFDKAPVSFVWNDKFVALGSAGRSDAVVIVDLDLEKEVDWFYCYEPRRIGESWIAYVEFYPSQTAENTTDVVLIYDLKHVPEDNRLPASTKSSSPRYPIQVGRPIYPSWNVLHQSYKNSVDTIEGAFQILGPPFLTYVAPDRIAFVATQGHDVSDYQNFLVVVDVASGLEKPAIHTYEIPRDQLHRSGEHPNYITVHALRQIDRNTIELDVPEDVYGVKHVSIQIQ